MIGYFPTTYPDELFYSICARFHNFMQYPTVQCTMHELFGNKNIRASIDLPRHLTYLVSVLPRGHHYTVERFIDNHTLLPFYSPFCPRMRVEQVREDMGGNNPVGVHSRLGILAIPRPNQLRFCPLCAQEDKKQFGESYWHRLHQLPGVEVCPTHAVFLENSEAPASYQEKSYDLISAQQGIQLKSPHFLNFSDASHSVLLKIANDAAWLLNHPFFVPSLKSLHQRYLKRLIERQLATYKGWVNSRKLLQEFKTFCSPDLLEFLHCSLEEQKKNNWLLALVRPPKSNVHNPIHHLLLIHFLGYRVADFFQLSDQFNPFGESPWPCLNPVCFHFKQPHIQECLINYNWHNRKVTGTFECTCGFIYSRRYPDPVTEDRFRFTRVECYGRQWEMVLTTLWSDPEISLSQIAHRLGAGRHVVKRQAFRLGLEFPRSSNRPIRISTQQMEHLSNYMTAKQNKLETYRLEWLSIREANPKWERKQLRTTFPNLYIWLHRHDLEWLEAHTPPPNKVPSPSSPRLVDWGARDAQLRTAVLTLAQKLSQASGRPVRITKHLLGRELGQLTQIYQNSNKLPLTSQVLEQVVETREAFAIRRIRWAAECFRVDNLCPTQWQLVKFAGGLAPELAALPQVLVAIATAVQSLEPEVACWQNTRPN